MRPFPGSLRGFLAFVLLALAALARARAGTAIVDVGNAPVLNVQMSSGAVTIRTWNRPQIEIDTQGTVRWQHYSADQVAAQIPTQFSILSESAITPQGIMTLPAEVWVLPPLSAQPHEGLTLSGAGATTITVPTTTSLIAARITTQGSISLQDYSGVLFTAVHTGSILLNNVSGIGFAQVVRGPIVAANSTFDRFRARTVAGNVFFENVNASQIRVSSARGNIIYDNGSFQPGLARFESQYGNIALGVASGSAQIGAHSDTGNVVTNFNNSRNISSTNGNANSPNGRATNTYTTDATATYNGGGPTVTANTNHGNIILYDGQLSDHPTLAQRFPGIARLQQNLVILRSASGAPRRTLQQKFPQNRHI